MYCRAGNPACGRLSGGAPAESRLQPGLAAPLLFFLLLSGCTRQSPAPRVERIAILRFENLGADVSGDWMGRAFSELITAELAGAPSHAWFIGFAPYGAGPRKIAFSILVENGVYGGTTAAPAAAQIVAAALELGLIQP